MLTIQPKVPINSVTLMKKENRMNFKKMMRLILLLGTLIILHAGSLFGADWSKDQQQIWKMEEKYWHYLKSADIEGYKNLLHEDALPWPGGSYLPTNKAQTIAYIERWFGYDRLKSYNIEPHAIHVIDNVAVVCYSYKLKGDRNSDSGRITHTWLRQKGVWKMIGGMNASYVVLPRHKKVE